MNLLVSCCNPGSPVAFPPCADTSNIRPVAGSRPGCRPHSSFRWEGSSLWGHPPCRQRFSPHHYGYREDGGLFTHIFHQRRYPGQDQLLNTSSRSRSTRSNDETRAYHIFPTHRLPLKNLVSIVPLLSIGFAVTRLASCRPWRSLAMNAWSSTLATAPPHNIATMSSRGPMRPYRCTPQWKPPQSSCPRLRVSSPTFQVPVRKYARRNAEEDDAEIRDGPGR